MIFQKKNNDFSLPDKYIKEIESEFKTNYVDVFIEPEQRITKKVYQPIFDLRRNQELSKRISEITVFEPKYEIVSWKYFQSEPILKLFKVTRTNNVMSTSFITLLKPKVLDALISYNGFSYEIQDEVIMDEQFDMNARIVAELKELRNSQNLEDLK